MPSSHHRQPKRGPREAQQRRRASTLSATTREPARRTLGRGARVVVQPGRSVQAAAAHVERAIDFSLFYFASEETTGDAGKYRLLLEGAKFADLRGFAAVWTPERHFHAFGGIYPNQVFTVTFFKATSPAFLTTPEKASVSEPTLVTSMRGLRSTWQMAEPVFSTFSPVHWSLPLAVSVSHVSSQGSSSV